MTAAVYTVAPDGSGDFRYLSDAVSAAAGIPGARLFVRNGVYREKIYCDAVDLTIQGESQTGVRLVWGDGAYHLHGDGRPTGTFRSYTAFFTGGRIRVENMTIENAVGDGAVHGQGIAAAVDARRAVFCHVTLLGHQDTLFTGPLPDHERLPGGFLGPKQYTPRIPSVQYYESCTIAGTVDFIFGGADALFSNCTLCCRGTDTGYIAAPSTAPGRLGYVFYRCTVTSECAARGIFYLARPWRAYGRCVFLYCHLGDVIQEEGFHDWGNPENRKTACFCEYGTFGPGARARRGWGSSLTKAQALALLKKIRGE